MKTKTIGQLLKERRERAEVSLAQLQQLTAIPIATLQALEADQFSRLPSVLFIQGYVRWYAELFGFDVQPVFAMLRRDYRVSDSGALQPVALNAKGASRAQPLPIVQWSVLVLSTFFVVLFSYVGYQWYLSQQPPQLTVSEPAEQAVVAGTVTIKGSTVIDARVSVNAAPVPLLPDGSFETEILLPREGLNTITIEAKDQRGKINLQQRTVFVRL